MDETKDRLRRLKRRDRLTGKSIAGACEVSPQTVFKWLKGSMPKAQNVTKLAALFNVTPDYIVHGDTDQSRVKAITDLREEIASLSAHQIFFLVQVAREISHRS